MAICKPAACKKPGIVISIAAGKIHEPTLKIVFIAMILHIFKTSGKDINVTYRENTSKAVKKDRLLLMPEGIAAYHESL